MCVAGSTTQSTMPKIPKRPQPQIHRSDLQAMVDVMEYATNKDKTEQRFFVTGINCDPTTARDEMMIAKVQWNDTSEIVCYHGFQSFKHGEVTPEQAHEVGVKLAERMWGDRFQVIVATHLNTDCLHNHFVVNSVSFADGMHYHDNKANLRLLRQRSDELCREYALSVIEHPSGKKKPYALYQAEKQGRPTRDNVARQAVDEAISKSFTLKNFDRTSCRSQQYRFLLAADPSFSPMPLPTMFYQYQHSLLR